MQCNDISWLSGERCELRAEHLGCHEVRSRIPRRGDKATQWYSYDPARNEGRPNPFAEVA